MFNSEALLVITKQALHNVAVKSDAHTSKGRPPDERIERDLKGVEALAKTGLLADYLARSVDELAMQSNDNARARDNNCTARVTVKCRRIVENVMRMEANYARLVRGNAQACGIRRLFGHANVARDEKKAALVRGLDNAARYCQKERRGALASGKPQHRDVQLCVKHCDSKNEALAALRAEARDGLDVFGRCLNFEVVRNRERRVGETKKATPTGFPSRKTARMEPSILARCVGEIS